MPDRHGFQRLDLLGNRHAGGVPQRIRAGERVQTLYGVPAPQRGKHVRGELIRACRRQDHRL